MREAAGEIEERARRRGLVIDDTAVFAFYDARIPPDVASVRHFDSWWRQRRRTHPHDLDLDPELLRSAAATSARPGDFPDHWEFDGQSYPLRYEFAPGSEFDGVSVDVPLSALNRIRPAGFDWGVPGLREELVTALLRALPKAVRRSVSPATTYAAAVLPHLNSSRGVARRRVGPGAAELVRRADRSRRLGVGTGSRVSADHVPGAGPGR